MGRGCLPGHVAAGGNGTPCAPSPHPKRQGLWQRSRGKSWVLLASRSRASAGESGVTHATGTHSARSTSLPLLMWVLCFCGASN